jgi:hypothetical protein
MTKDKAMNDRKELAKWLPIVLVILGAAAWVGTSGSQLAELRDTKVPALERRIGSVESQETANERALSKIENDVSWLRKLFEQDSWRAWRPRRPGNP